MTEKIVELIRRFSPISCRASTVKSSRTTNGMNAPTYRVGHAKGGGPSRADGIKVPKRKIIEIFTGKPEGPS